MGCLKLDASYYEKSKLCIQRGAKYRQLKTGVGGIQTEVGKSFNLSRLSLESGVDFLHKDYLGSVLTISDQQANILEKRSFDTRWRPL